MRIQKFTAILENIRQDATGDVNLNVLSSDCGHFYEGLYECLKQGPSLCIEEKVEVLTIAINVYALVRPRCSQDDQAADALGHFIFIESVELVLDINFIQLDDDNVQKTRFKAELHEAKTQLAGQAVAGPIFNMLAHITGNEWNHPTLSAIMNGEDVDEGAALNYLQTEEYPEVTKLRVTMLMRDGCESLALHLSEWMLRCHFFSDDPKVLQTHLLILYRLDRLDEFHKKCVGVKCCMGLTVLKQMIEMTRAQEKQVVLITAQTFLLQDWMKPSKFCCTKELLEIWLQREFEQTQENQSFINSITKILLLAESSQQLTILLDAMVSKFGSKFRHLCTEIAVKAVRVDRHRLDSARTYTKDEKETDAAAASLAHLCQVVASLYESHSHMAVSCMVAALYLDATPANYSCLKKAFTDVQAPPSHMTQPPDDVGTEVFDELNEMVLTLRPAKFDPQQGWSVVNRVALLHLEEAGYKFNSVTSSFINMLDKKDTGKKLSGKHFAQVPGAVPVVRQTVAKPETNSVNEKKQVIKWEVKQPQVSKNVPVVSSPVVLQPSPIASDLSTPDISGLSLSSPNLAHQLEAGAQSTHSGIPKSAKANHQQHVRVQREASTQSAGRMVKPPSYHRQPSAPSPSLQNVTLDEIQQVICSPSSETGPVDAGALKHITEFLHDGLTSPAPHVIGGGDPGQLHSHTIQKLQDKVKTNVAKHSNLQVSPAQVLSAFVQQHKATIKCKQNPLPMAYPMKDADKPNASGHMGTKLLSEAKSGNSVNMVNGTSSSDGSVQLSNISSNIVDSCVKPSHSVTPSVVPTSVPRGSKSVRAVNKAGRPSKTVHSGTRPTSSGAVQMNARSVGIMSPQSVNGTIHIGTPGSQLVKGVNVVSASATMMKQPSMSYPAKSGATSTTQASMESKQVVYSLKRLGNAMTVTKGSKLQALLEQRIKPEILKPTKKVVAQKQVVIQPKVCQHMPVAKLLVTPQQIQNMHSDKDRLLHMQIPHAKKVKAPQQLLANNPSVKPQQAQVMLSQIQTVLPAGTQQPSVTNQQAVHVQHDEVKKQKQLPQQTQIIHHQMQLLQQIQPQAVQNPRTGKTNTSFNSNNTIGREISVSVGGTASLPVPQVNTVIPTVVMSQFAQQDEQQTQEPKTISAAYLGSFVPSAAVASTSLQSNIAPQPSLMQNITQLKVVNSPSSSGTQVKVLNPGGPLTSLNTELKSTSVPRTSLPSSCDRILPSITNSSLPSENQLKTVASDGILASILPTPCMSTRLLSQPLPSAKQSTVVVTATVVSQPTCQEYQFASSNVPLSSAVESVSATSAPNNLQDNLHLSTSVTPSRSHQKEAIHAVTKAQCENQGHVHTNKSNHVGSVTGSCAHSTMSSAINKTTKSTCRTPKSPTYSQPRGSSNDAVKTGCNKVTGTEVQEQDTSDFSCKFCKKEFESLSKRSRHQEMLCPMRDGFQEEASAGGSEQNDSQPEIYFCDICSKEFVDEAAVKRHISKVHTVVTRPRIEPEVSSVASQSTASGGSGYVCELCGKVMDTKRGRNSHMIRVHGFIFEAAEINMGLNVNRSKPRKFRASSGELENESPSPCKKEEDMQLKGPKTNKAVPAEGKDALNESRSLNALSKLKIQTHPSSLKKSGIPASTSECSVTLDKYTPVTSSGQAGDSTDLMPSVDADAKLNSLPASLLANDNNHEKVKFGTDSLKALDSCSGNSSDEVSLSDKDETFTLTDDTDNDDPVPKRVLRSHLKTEQRESPGLESLLYYKLPKGIKLKLCSVKLERVKDATLEFKKAALTENQSDGYMCDKCGYLLTGEEMSSHPCERTSGLSSPKKHLPHVASPGFIADPASNNAPLSENLEKCSQDSEKPINSVISDGRSADPKISVVSESLCCDFEVFHSCYKEAKVSESMLKDAQISENPLEDDQVPETLHEDTQVSETISKDAQVSEIVSNDAQVSEIPCLETSLSSSTPSTQGQDSCYVAQHTRASLSLPVASTRAMVATTPNEQMTNGTYSQTNISNSVSDALIAEMSCSPIIITPIDSAQEERASIAESMAAPTSGFENIPEGVEKFAQNEPTDSSLADVKEESCSLKLEMLYSGIPMIVQTKFLCAKCYKAFVSHADLIRHQTEDQHQDAKVIEYKVYECKYCGLSYQTKLSLQKHVLKRCKSAYDADKQKIGGKSTEQGQVLHVISPDQNQHQCSLCPKVFRSNVALRSHVAKVHPNNMKLPGEPLDMVNTSDFDELVQFVAESTSVNTPTQSLCSDSEQRNDSSFAEVDSPFTQLLQTPLPTDEIDENKGLPNWMAIETEEPTGQPQDRDEADCSKKYLKWTFYKNVGMTTKKVIKCKLCSKLLSTKKIFQDHLQGACGLDFPQVSLHGYCCPFCQSIFRSKKLCREHQVETCLKDMGCDVDELSAPRLSCPQCNQKVFSSSNLALHLKMKHDFSKVQVCEYIDKLTMNGAIDEFGQAIESKQLIVPVEQVPSKQLPSQTSPALSLSTLSGKYREWHNSLRKIESRCGLGEKDGSHYKNVKISCVSEFKCQMCGNLMNSKLEVNAHKEKGCCGKTGDDVSTTRVCRYACPFCKEKFVGRVDCRKHMVDQCIVPNGLDPADYEKPMFLCPHDVKCPPFWSLKNLALHMHTKHNMSKDDALTLNQLLIKASKETDIGPLVVVVSQVLKEMYSQPIQSAIREAVSKEDAVNIREVVRKKRVVVVLCQTRCSQCGQVVVASKFSQHIIAQQSCSTAKCKSFLRCVCPYCFHVSESTNASFEHVKTCSNREETAPSLKYSCEKCLCKFYTSCALQWHTIFYHANEDTKNVDSEGKANVEEEPMVDQTVSTNNAEQKQQSISQQSFVLFKNILMYCEWYSCCEKCCTLFKTEEDFTEHLRVCGEKENPTSLCHFSCPFCSQVFPSKDVCRKHQLESCLKENGYDTNIIRCPQIECPVKECPKRVYDGLFLKTHLESHNIGENDIDEILQQMQDLGILGANLEALLYENNTNDDLSSGDELDMSEDPPEVMDNEGDASEDPPEVMDNEGDVSVDPPEVMDNEGDVSVDTPEVMDNEGDMSVDTPEVMDNEGDVCEDPSEIIDNVGDVREDPSEVIDNGVDVHDDPPEVMDNDNNQHSQGSQDVTFDSPSPMPGLSTIAKLKYEVPPSKDGLKTAIFNNVAMHTKYLTTCKKCKAVLGGKKSKENHVKGPCGEPLKLKRVILYFCPFCNQKFERPKHCVDHQVSDCLKKTGVDVAQLLTPQVPCHLCDIKFFDILRLCNHLKSFHKLSYSEIKEVMAKMNYGKRRKGKGTFSGKAGSVKREPCPNNEGKDVLVAKADEEDGGFGIADSKKRGPSRNTEDEDAVLVTNPDEEDPYVDGGFEMAYENVIIVRKLRHESKRSDKKLCSYHCSSCDAGFKTLRNCRDHILKKCLKIGGFSPVHLKQPRLFCPLCALPAFDVGFLRSHLRKNHSFPKSCIMELLREMCLFKSSAFVKVQKACFASPNPLASGLILKCPDCSIIASNERLLLYHKKYLCGTESPKLKEFLDSATSSDAPGQCGACDKVLNHPLSKMFHEISHESASPTSEVTSHSQSMDCEIQSALLSKKTVGSNAPVSDMAEKGKDGKNAPEEMDTDETAMLNTNSASPLNKSGDLNIAGPASSKFATPVSCSSPQAPKSLEKHKELVEASLPPDMPQSSEYEAVGAIKTTSEGDQMPFDDMANKTGNLSMFRNEDKFEDTPNTIEASSVSTQGVAKGEKVLILPEINEEVSVHGDVECSTDKDGPSLSTPAIHAVVGTSGPIDCDTLQMSCGLTCGNAIACSVSGDGIGHSEALSSCSEGDSLEFAEIPAEASFQTESSVVQPDESRESESDDFCDLGVSAERKLSDGHGCQAQNVGNVEDTSDTRGPPADHDTSMEDLCVLDVSTQTEIFGWESLDEESLSPRTGANDVSDTRHVNQSCEGKTTEKEGACEHEQVSSKSITHVQEKTADFAKPGEAQHTCSLSSDVGNPTVESTATGPPTELSHQTETVYPSELNHPQNDATYDSSFAPDKAVFEVMEFMLTQICSIEQAEMNQCVSRSSSLADGLVAQRDCSTPDCLTNNIQDSITEQCILAASLLNSCAEHEGTETLNKEAILEKGSLSAEGADKQHDVGCRKETTDHLTSDLVTQATLSVEDCSEEHLPQSTVQYEEQSSVIPNIDMGDQHSPSTESIPDCEDKLCGISQSDEVKPLSAVSSAFEQGRDMATYEEPVGHLVEEHDVKCLQDNLPAGASDQMSETCFSVQGHSLVTQIIIADKKPPSLEANFETNDQLLCSEESLSGNEDESTADEIAIPSSTSVEVHLEIHPSQCVAEVEVNDQILNSTKLLEVSHVLGQQSSSEAVVIKEPMLDLHVSEQDSKEKCTNDGSEVLLCGPGILKEVPEIGGTPQLSQSYADTEADQACDVSVSDHIEVVLTADDDEIINELNTSQVIPSGPCEKSDIIKEDPSETMEYVKAELTEPPDGNTNEQYEATESCTSILEEDATEKCECLNSFEQVLVTKEDRSSLATETHSGPVFQSIHCEKSTLLTEDTTKNAATIKAQITEGGEDHTDECCENVSSGFSLKEDSMQTSECLKSAEQLPELSTGSSRNLAGDADSEDDVSGNADDVTHDQEVCLECPAPNHTLPIDVLSFCESHASHVSFQKETSEEENAESPAPEDAMVTTQMGASDEAQVTAPSAAEVESGKCMSQDVVSEEPKTSVCSDQNHQAVESDSNTLSVDLMEQAITPVYEKELSQITSSSDGPTAADAAIEVNDDERKEVSDEDDLGDSEFTMQQSEELCDSVVMEQLGDHASSEECARENVTVSTSSDDLPQQDESVAELEIESVTGSDLDQGKVISEAVSVTCMPCSSVAVDSFPFSIGSVSSNPSSSVSDNNVSSVSVNNSPSSPTNSLSISSVSVGSMPISSVSEGNVPISSISVNNMPSSPVINVLSSTMSVDNLPSSPVNITGISSTSTSGNCETTFSVSVNSFPSSPVDSLVISSVSVNSLSSSSESVNCMSSSSVPVDNIPSSPIHVSTIASSSLSVDIMPSSPIFANTLPSSSSSASGNTVPPSSLSVDSIPSSPVLVNTMASSSLSVDIMPSSPIFVNTLLSSSFSRDNVPSSSLSVDNMPSSPILVNSVPTPSVSGSNVPTFSVMTLSESILPTEVEPVTEFQTRSIIDQQFTAQHSCNDTSVAESSSKEIVPSSGGCLEGKSNEIQSEPVGQPIVIDHLESKEVDIVQDDMDTLLPSRSPNQVAEGHTPVSGGAASCIKSEHVRDGVESNTSSEHSVVCMQLTQKENTVDDSPDPLLDCSNVSFTDNLTRAASPATKGGCEDCGLEDVFTEVLNCQVCDEEQVLDTDMSQVTDSNTVDSESCNEDVGKLSDDQCSTPFTQTSEVTDINKSEVTDIDKSEVTDIGKIEVTDINKSEVTVINKSKVTDIDKIEVTDIGKIEVTDINKSEVTDINKSEVKDINKSEVTDIDKSEVTDELSGPVSPDISVEKQWQNSDVQNQDSDAAQACLKDVELCSGSSDSPTVSKTEQSTETVDSACEQAHTVASSPTDCERLATDDSVTEEVRQSPLDQQLDLAVSSSETTATEVASPQCIEPTAGKEHPEPEEDHCNEKLFIAAAEESLPISTLENGALPSEPVLDPSPTVLLKDDPDIVTDNCLLLGDSCDVTKAESAGSDGLVERICPEKSSHNEEQNIIPDGSFKLEEDTEYSSDSLSGQEAQVLREYEEDGKVDAIKLEADGTDDEISDLTSHTQESTPDQFICIHCDKHTVFHSEYSFRSHLSWVHRIRTTKEKTAADDLQLKCLICKKEDFDSESSLQCHMKWVHNVRNFKAIPPERPRSVSSTNDKSSASDQKDQPVHKDVKHSDVKLLPREEDDLSNVVDKAADNVVLCSKSQPVSSEKNSRVPLPQAVCKACDKEFKSQSELLAHGRESHAKLEGWVCIICGISLYGHIQWRAHVDEKHPNQTLPAKPQSSPLVLFNESCHQVKAIEKPVKKREKVTRSGDGSQSVHGKSKAPENELQAKQPDVPSGKLDVIDSKSHQPASLVKVYVSGENSKVIHNIGKGSHISVYKKPEKTKATKINVQDVWAKVTGQSYKPMKTYSRRGLSGTPSLNRAEGNIEEKKCEDTQLGSAKQEVGQTGKSEEVKSKTDSQESVNSRQNDQAVLSSTTSKSECDQPSSSNSAVPVNEDNVSCTTKKPSSLSSIRAVSADKEVPLSSKTVSQPEKAKENAGSKSVKLVRVITAKQAPAIEKIRSSSSKRVKVFTDQSHTQTDSPAKGDGGSGSSSNTVFTLDLRCAVQAPPVVNAKANQDISKPAPSKKPRTYERQRKISSDDILPASAKRVVKESRSKDCFCCKATNKCLINQEENKPSPKTFPDGQKVTKSSGGQKQSSIKPNNSKVPDVSSKCGKKRKKSENSNPPHKDGDNVKLHSEKNHKNKTGSKVVDNKSRKRQSSAADSEPARKRNKSKSTSEQKKRPCPETGNSRRSSKRLCAPASGKTGTVVKK